jgi:hypothetical protein
MYRMLMTRVSKLNLGSDRGLRSGSGQDKTCWRDGDAGDSRGQKAGEETTDNWIALKLHATAKKTGVGVMNWPKLNRPLERPPHEL